VRLVEVGLECNNRCTFCAQGQLRAAAIAPDTRTLLARIAELSPGEPIALVGGEPTLRPDLTELVSGARARTPSVLLQTNARRLKVSGYARALAEAGLGALEVSLHGSTEAMHDYHTQSAGSLRDTVAALGRARAARLPFSITVVVTRSNYRHLAEVTHVCHALGARAIQLLPVRLHGSALDTAPRLLAPGSLVAPHAQRALETAARLGIEWLAGERVSRPEVREWFAGIGSIEPPIARRAASAHAELNQAGAI
jgi:MoaA/NifB/PqqE/SkfB family radical SAM enzyme